MEVKETLNYDEFKTCDWNRGVSKTALKKLDTSVKKNGWLKHPILVNENMEIIDGQHRYLYAKEHDLPVYYMVISGLGVTDCVTMNNSRTSWTLVDYIKYYAKLGNKSYIALEELLKKYPYLTPSILANILRGTNLSGATCAFVREGTFEITDEQYEAAVEKLEFISRVFEFIVRVPGRPSALVTAVSFAYDCPGVDHQKLEKQLRTNSSIIIPPANLDMAIRQIEYLYNYRSLRSEYVYIYNTYEKTKKQRIAHRREA